MGKKKNLHFGILLLTIVLSSGFRSETAAQNAACRGDISDLNSDPEANAIYVPDTNIFHSDPEFLTHFARFEIVIPRTVLQELDRHKTETSDRGRTARFISAEIARLMDQSESNSDIKLSEGGLLHIDEVADEFKMPSGLYREKADDRIIALALQLKQKDPNRPVVLLTRDNNMRALARSLNLKARTPKVKVDLESVHRVMSGPVHIKVSSENIAHLSSLEDLALSKKDMEALGLPSDLQLLDNQYIVFESSRAADAKKSISDAYPLIWKYRNPSKNSAGTETLPFRRVNISKLSQLVIKPRNIEQIVALDLLLDPEVSLVTLAGTAGTGKTLLTLSAGLAQSPLLDPNHPFEKIIFTRPIQVTGQDVGFLPGTLEEKMDPYLGPMKDNLEVFIENIRKGGKPRGDDFNRGIEIPSKGRKSTSERSSSKGSLGKGLAYEDFLNTRLTAKDLTDRFLKSDFFSLEAITFSRGRTWRNTLLIIDEAQNLSLHEAQTILTRAGEGTKVVLMGDLQQIDSRFLTQTDNGLIITASRFQGKHLAGHITLTEGERSELSKMAAELLAPGR